MTNQRFKNHQRLVLACCLISITAPVAATEEQTTDILPIWRKIFARQTTTPDAIPAPAKNPLTNAKVKLGKFLFQDTRLSGDGTRSCMTCHDPKRAFTDGRKRAAALDGKTPLANTPTLVNLAWAKRFFWDGRATSLEEQASFPIEQPHEMAGSWNEIVKRLASDPQMNHQFRLAFPDSPSPTREKVIAALASYQRTLVWPPSRFDKFISGDSTAFTQQEQAGFRLFVGKAGCVSCHSGWRLTDDRLHLTGRSNKPIKTPTLRQLTRTAPYMHNGSISSIEGVLAHYVTLEPQDKTLSPNLVRPLNLTSVEKDALSAFLKSID